jgi:hypothetical protein
VITPELRDAVTDLELVPRTRVWTSLTFCILDAVWSIGAHYDRIVVPVVGAVATAAGVPQATAAVHDAPADDSYPLDQFLADYQDPGALAAVTNRQRTSTRSGILKADASLRYADVLRSHGITSRSDASAASADEVRVAEVDARLARIPGDGVRRGYFWMLVGDDHRVKPDRMVLRFLHRYGVPADAAAAREVLAGLAVELTDGTREVTPWMIDHAIWRAERRRTS